MGSDDDRPTSPDVEGVETTYGRTSAFRPALREPLLVRTFPVSGEVPVYRGSAAGRDLLAGLTVAALALPSAMAYGQLAGLSPGNSRV